MTTPRQAKRARKKANKAKGRQEEILRLAEEAMRLVESRIEDGELEREPEARVITESEHAAAMAALAKAKRMRNRKGS